MSDELDQRRRDAAVGRALRETANIAPDEPRIHVSWCTGDGRARGRYLLDHPLYSERIQLAEAAADLYEAAAEWAEPVIEDPDA